MKFALGFDGSNSAKEALAVVAKYAGPLDAAVAVITSKEGGTGTEDAEIQKARDALDYAERYLREKGIPVESHLLIRGVTPGEDIVAYARENGVDTVFLGIQRRSKVGKLVFGSNAQYVILNAPCPVMTVR